MVCEQGGIWRTEQEVLGLSAFLLGWLSTAAASLMPASARSSTALRTTWVRVLRGFEVAEDTTVMAESASTPEIPSDSTRAAPLSSRTGRARPPRLGAGPSG